MRQIKFRAWDKENEVMIYDNDGESEFKCVNGEIKVRYQATQWKEGGGETYEVYSWEDVDAISMQFTGLTDKNGNEIYDKDVDSNGYIVGWNQLNGHWELQYPDGVSKMFPIPENIEIIGNVHENPELLNP